MRAEPIRLVSVVIPVYNEAASLPELLRRTEAACATLGTDWEIVLVDDGSRDGSTDLLIEAADRSDGRVIAVVLTRNYRQHAALMAGFAEARGDVMVTLDADLQNPPEEIPRLVAEAAKGYDVVGTVRVNRQDSWFRRVASRLVNHAVQRATGVAMHDYGCMLRAYRRGVIDAMLRCEERSTFIPVLANTFARDTTEIDVEHDERRHGQSKYDLMKLVNLMFDLLTCTSTTPLRLLSILGVLLAGAGFVSAAALLALRIVFGAEWGVNGVFPLFAVAFFFIGGQFVALGVLGEYIGRTYNDVRARPRYLVERVVRADADAAPGRAARTSGA